MKPPKWRRLNELELRSRTLKTMFRGDGAPVSDIGLWPSRGYPFWGYFDLLVIVGMWFAAWVVNGLSMGIMMAVLHMPVGANPGTGLVLMNQSVFYALFFGSLALWLRVQYDHPFWRSLGWTEMRLSVFRTVLFGLATCYAVAVFGALIRTPATPSQMTQLIAGRTSLLLMAAFGITVGPLCEELAFRGFLQPLLVRSLGAAPGIILAAIPFGALHFREYGNSWRHALIVAIAGAAFGWMRYRTGSTKASTLMHASFNALTFVGVALQR